VSEVSDLRVEYLGEPIGIGTRVPRFSWITGHVQDGYELVVTSGDRAVWETGVLETAD